MTVETTNVVSGPYTGTGVAGQTFSVTFQSAGAAEIQITVNDAIVNPGDYTFARNADGTGTVTSTTGLTGEVYVHSLPAFTQETEFQRYGPYFPDDLNAPLDRAAIRDIYLKAQIEELGQQDVEASVTESATYARASQTASALAIAAANRAAVSAAGANQTDSPAVALAPISEPQIVIIDATTTHANNIFIRDNATPAKDFNGTLDAFVPGTMFNVGKNVVDQAGNTVAVAAGDVPYDWSTGVKAIKVKSTDLFAITAAKYTFNDKLTLVANFTTGTGDGSWLQLDEGTHFLSVGASGTSILLQLTDIAGSDPDMIIVLGDVPPAGSAMEIALRLETGVASVSLNNEPWRKLSHHSIFAAYATPDSFTPSQILIGSTTNDCYLHRFQMISHRLVADAEFQSLFRSVRPLIAASVTAGYFRDTYGTDNGDRYREPSLCVFDDGSASRRAAGVMMAMHRYGGAGAIESEPTCRIVGWPFSMEEGAETIGLGTRFVIYQPALWASARGQSQSAVAVKCKVGANRGKTLIYVHDYLGATMATTIGPAGLASLAGSIRLGISEKNMTDVDPNYASAFWTTVYTSDVGDYALPGPGCNPIELPEWHTHAGRIGFPVYTPAGLHLFRRNVDGTHTLSSPATGTPGAYVPNEAGCALCPNGDIIVFARLELTAGGDAQNALGIYRSSAATAFESLVCLDVLTAADGYAGAAVGLGVTQTDPEGAFGPLGRIAVSRARTAGTPIRHGNRISFFEDETFVERDAFDSMRQGQTRAYSAIASIFGGTELALVGEHSLDGAVNARDAVDLSRVPVARAVAL